MTRPRCRLLGIEFALPIQMDEIPQTHGDVGSGNKYVTIDGEKIVNQRIDNRRDTTRHDVRCATDAHWDVADAMLHIEALKALRVYLKEHAK